MKTMPASDADAEACGEQYQHGRHAGGAAHGKRIVRPVESRIETRDQRADPGYGMTDCAKQRRGIGQNGFDAEGDDQDQDAVGRVGHGWQYALAG